MILSNRPGERQGWIVLLKGVPPSRMVVRIGDSRVRMFGDVAVATRHQTFVDRRDGQEIPRPA